MHLDSRTIYLLIICILSLIGWGGLARTIRGMVFSIRQEDFVKAAVVSGSSHTKIIFKHVLPQTWSVVLIMMSSAIPGFILSESALSLIGLGIQDPYASWGSLLSEAMSISQLELHTWVLWPGVMITITIMCFNALGDYLRDWLDPKQNNL
jgi:peptide/nickel transport system permease protein